MEEKHYRKLRRYKLHLYSGILGILFLIVIINLARHSFPREANADSESRFWKYQCIDTMKTSRDRARNWQYSTDLHHSVSKQVSLIKSMGANCIAIDTPYDAEFLPYMRSWVTEARKQDLHIWFRGNFSSWEAWFEYPKGMTSKELLPRTASFIEKNQDLFADGDIFTPAPEGENGGEFNQVEIDEHVAFRKFLIDEYTVAKTAFAKIGKNVEVNWLSMNGGLAKRMLDKQTISQIGDTVALDHYIKTAPEMSEFITYFADKFGAKLVIGEMGAPIPDINGSMTEDEQAAFIDSLYLELFKQRDKITGVNYWVLYDSSTALINPDGTARKAAAIVKKYYQPLVIKGIVKDTFNTPLTDVPIAEKTYGQRTTTDINGAFSITIPRSSTEIMINEKAYLPQTFMIKENNTKNITVVLSKESPTLWDKIRAFFKR